MEHVRAGVGKLSSVKGKPVNTLGFEGHGIPVAALLNSAMIAHGQPQTLHTHMCDRVTGKLHCGH